MPVDPLLRPIVESFANEARDLGQKLTLDVLDLERAGAPEKMKAAHDRVARGLHTLKGSASTLGLDDLASLAHRLEDLAAPHRARGAALPAAVVDALLRSLDALLARVAATAAGNEDALPPLEPVLALIEAAAASGAADQPGAPPQAPSSDEAPVAPDADDGTWRIGAQQLAGLLRDVERLREVRLRLEERHRDVLGGLDELERRERRVETAATRARLGGAGRLLASDAEETAEIVRSLEEGLRALATLPASTLLEPLHRTVRDACHRTGRRARLSIVGGEVTLDRRLIQGLRGPLLHLVRNAVDHGIEPPAERDAKGKDAEGLVTIRVDQQGNVLFLEVADDGRGIDANAVREVALGRGIVTREQLERMSLAQVQGLVFQPGFTTRSEVTETSGRGIGLDVVKGSVAALGGTVELESSSGQGTRFVLTVPVELGSSHVLMVRAGDHRVGLPMLSVEFMKRTVPAELRETGSGLLVAHQERLVPVVDLGALLGLRQAFAPVENQPLLVVQAQGRRVALSVDEVIGHEELTIRALPPELRDAPPYQGAATLARGELLLVLRPEWITGERAPAPAARAPRALVVDDSLTARALHRAALEAGGFEVHAVGDAARALAQLARTAYDVVVSDVAMEGASGVELVARVRERPEGARLPVVLVSAHDAAAERERGLAAGADGFLSKRDCAAGRLVDEVARAIARRRGAAT